MGWKREGDRQTGSKALECGALVNLWVSVLGAQKQFFHTIGTFESKRLKVPL
jgi:hypothetical protein